MAVNHAVVPRRVGDVQNPGAVLYGALIAASVLATASGHGGAFTSVTLATCTVLGIYWLAHVFVAAQSLQLAGDTRRFLRRLAHTGAQEVGVVVGGLPAVAVYGIVHLLGASKESAASVALYFSVAVLVLAGYLAARHAGRRGLASAVDAGTAGCFGILVIVAKAQLH